MPDVDEIALLREYVERNSESAFAEIVQRRVNLVYSTALRSTGNAEDAKDVTQAVFVILAKKAASLRPETILTGWLYETTRFISMNFLTRKNRRLAREQEAYMQSNLNDSEATNLWTQLAPLLENAMSRLSEKDRMLVFLRFFENRNMAETAALLGVKEAAARKRAERSIEKLRVFFSKHGVSSTTAIIAGVISANSVQIAPVGLAKAVSAVAVAKGATPSTSTLTLIKGALKLMAWTNAKSAIAVGVGILLVAGTATLTVKEVSHYRQETVWNQIIPSTDADSRVAQDWQQLRKARPAVSIRPTKFDSTRSGIVGDGNGKTMGIYRPFREVLSRAYDVMPGYIVPLTPLPPGNFDFIVSGQHPPANALRMEIESKYGLVGRRETRETDVMFLRVSRPNAPGLKPTAMPNSPSVSFWGVGHLRRSSGLIGQIVFDIQQNLQIPVVDQTGLTGRYDYDVKWDDELKWDDAGQWYYANTNGLKQAFLDQLGLELVAGREPVQVVVVDKK
jgi:uncharacterized protein (TIGR03435 family)